MTLTEKGRVALLRCEQLDELLQGGVEAVGVLAAGCGEVGLTATAALHELGSFADVLADVHACSYSTI